MPDAPAVAAVRNRRGRAVLALLLAVLGTGACSPTVRIVAPDEPIRIDLAVTVQQDVRITVSERPAGRDR